MWHVWRTRKNANNRPAPHTAGGPHAAHRDSLTSFGNNIYVLEMVII
jgi:hypothetical protein